MLGNPAISVLADAYEKGIREYDVQKAVEYAANTQKQFGNGDLGYTPGSLSHTLEYAYTDWCLGQLMSSLGRHSRCFPQRFFQQKRKHGSRKNYTPCNFCRCRIHCQKSGQFRICHRFFRLGWIRCRIRTGCSVFPVLETYQQMGRTCRYGLRWFHGIYLEIPDPPTWWYLEHL